MINALTCSLSFKRIGRALAILKTLNDAMESIALKDKQIFAIHRIFETSSDSHHVELIGNAMKASEEVNTESILQYLRLLTKKPIEPLCQLLGGVESAKWKKVITELSMIGYDYVMSYEHEDVTMSRQDGITKTIAYLKPLLIEAPYEGRHDVLFQ